MIRWIKKLLWRRKLENRSTIVVEKRTNTRGYKSSNYSLRELRNTLETGDYDGIINALERDLKLAGINEGDAQEIIQNLNEEKIKVVIKNIGLISELEKREKESHECKSSSPISF